MTTALTASQIKYLNNMAHGLAPLGDKLAELDAAYGAVSSQAAPVNAVKATKALTIDGVVISGEKVTFNNPLITGTDVYEFLADVAQVKSNSANKAVDIESHTTHSTGTLTIATQPTADDTMTIGGVVYTFVANGADDAAGKISVSTGVAGARTAIVAAINGTDAHNTANPKVSASTFQSTISTLTALVGGVVGDAVGTTESFTAVGNVFSGTTLGSGADCSAANAITALVAAITADDTQGVGAVDSTGGVVTLTADVAGAAGNNITLAETMAHGAFAVGATKLSGGVDGTVGLLHEIRSDGSYMYIASAPNTVADTNWRRFSIGAAY